MNSCWATVVGMLSRLEDAALLPRGLSRNVNFSCLAHELHVFDDALVRPAIFQQR